MASTANVRPVFASKKSSISFPPKPDPYGSATPTAKEVAIAASTAFPPAWSTATPAATASGCAATTIPCWAVTGLTSTGPLARKENDHVSKKNNETNFTIDHRVFAGLGLESSKATPPGRADDFAAAPTAPLRDTRRPDPFKNDPLLEDRDGAAPRARALYSQKSRAWPTEKSRWTAWSSLAVRCLA